MTDRHRWEMSMGLPMGDLCRYVWWLAVDLTQQGVVRKVQQAHRTIECLNAYLASYYYYTRGPTAPHVKLTRRLVPSRSTKNSFPCNGIRVGKSNLLVLL